MNNMNFAALVAVSLLLLQVGLVTAGSSHHHHNNNKNKKPRICKDRPGVHCHLIAEDGDCGKFTTNGESYGDAICQVSCGRCDEVPDEIFTDQLCYQFAKQVIDVRFSNRYVDLCRRLNLTKNGLDRVENDFDSIEHQLRQQ